jgi:hypothetical protein
MNLLWLHLIDNHGEEFKLHGNAIGYFYLYRLHADTSGSSESLLDNVNTNNCPSLDVMSQMLDLEQQLLYG